ncbi:TlpA family protein disulfide reductase [Maribacter aquivivus]|uniref:TlpA family protein disulfide reductase n=1 Tax=Maribacter aquivivus TaxID=228958 RepID=UPI002490ED7A|nr:TlpA disulfide reductase family protein [Maribacter aquivivus]
MKKILILLVLICITSCKENKETKAKNAETIAQKSDVDVNALESNLTTWWPYHENNIILSSEFIAINDKSEIIPKDDFLNLLTTGDYIPLKLIAPDSVRKYKLYKLSASADKKIREFIKSTSENIYSKFKMEGTPFPEFSFTDLDGKEYTNENTKGKVLVFKCWFINCAPCVAEFPELNIFVDEYKQRENVEFISLAIDDKAALDRFFSKKVFNYKTIPNQEDFIENKLFVKAYPTHIVVNENGSIEKVVGKATELISFLENGDILTTNKNEGLPPPPGPSL